MTVTKEQARRALEVLSHYGKDLKPDVFGPCREPQINMIGLGIALGEFARPIHLLTILRAAKGEYS